jgi:dTDP-4-dehydrorhamnose reductase
VKVLVTGADGQLGAAIMVTAPPDAAITATDVGEFDITSREQVMATVVAGKFDVIANCAAFTRVDDAEDRPEAAFAVNAHAVRHLAEAARTAGTRVIHFSTDYVFAGDAGRPYQPEDAPRPVNQYGASKLAGERALLETRGADGVVVRTAWLYSTAETSFVTRILARLQSQGAAKVVDDQVGTPTSATQLASFTWQLIRRPDVRGCLHWTDGGVASWYDFAVAIAEEGLRLGLLPRAPQVLPIASAEYPTRAARPAYSVLDKHSTARRLGLVPLHWRESLRQVLETLRRA